MPQKHQRSRKVSLVPKLVELLASIHPALIYAYQKTGRLVTQENQKFLSSADRQAWQNAIDEW